jgi:methionyl-tRNA formyltransferase
VIRAAFFGTPAEAVPVLLGVLQTATIELVVTRPDAPQGRSGEPVAPPVKVVAESRGLPVLQPRHPVDVLESIRDLDVAVVAAYGLLVPVDLLAAPAAGFVNLHYSLLPRWRGASPVVRTILAGDDVAGVTLIQMDEGLDTGPIYASESTAVRPGEATGELTARLAVLGGGLMALTLSGVVDGTLTPVPQDDSRATAAAKVGVAEAFLDPARHRVEAVDRAVRAFNPKPGAWAIVDGRRFKVWRVVPASGEVRPGVAVVDDDRVLLGCADGAVELLRVQPEGKPEMDALAWMNGRRREPAGFASG